MLLTVLGSFTNTEIMQQMLGIYLFIYSCNYLWYILTSIYSCICLFISYLSNIYPNIKWFNVLVLPYSLISVQMVKAPVKECPSNLPSLFTNPLYFKVLRKENRVIRLYQMLYKYQTVSNWEYTYTFHYRSVGRCYCKRNLK